MNSQMFKLNWRDIGKGLVVAVLATFLGAVQQALTAHGFDLGSYDWAGISHLAIVAGGSYIVKNIFSDDAGKFLGKIG